jgi:hypothetical protein
LSSAFQLIGEHLAGKKLGVIVIGIDYRISGRLWPAGRKREEGKHRDTENAE